MARGIKRTRQKIVVTHNPSETDQNQLLLVRFPNLGSDSIIVPGTVNLSFNIELFSKADPNRMLVSNISRAIMKKLAVKFEGNEILSTSNCDVSDCYKDLWKMKLKKQNVLRQGTIPNYDGCTENSIKLRINTKDKDATNDQDAAVENAYINKFIILLDLEMLDSSILYCSETGYVTKLHSRIIVSTEASPDVNYKISDISLECEIVTQPDLTRHASIGVS